jgi:hypothetical protein
MPSRKTISYLSPHGRRIGDINYPFRAFHPADATMPAFFLVGRLGYILIFIPDKDVQRAQLIAFLATDTIL